MLVRLLVASGTSHCVVEQLVTLKTVGVHNASMCLQVEEVHKLIAHIEECVTKVKSKHGEILADPNNDHSKCKPMIDNSQTSYYQLTDSAPK